MATSGSASAPSLQARAALELPSLPPRAIAAGTVLLACLAGALIAVAPAKGLALVLVACYVPVVLLNLPVGLALWLPTTFLTGVEGIDTASQAGAVLIAFAWLGNLRRQRHATAPQVVWQQWLLALFAIWLTLSIAWSADTGEALSALMPWVVAAVLFVIVVTSELDERGIRALLGAYVVGVLLSISVGLLDGLQPQSEATTLAFQEGRLQGGSGDPNYLAASIVPALALATGLVATARRPGSQLAFGAAIPLLVVGLVATESRGGMLAAIVAMALAVAVAKRGRIWVVALLTAIVAVAAFWFAATPSAFERVTDTANQGNGRGSLWKVAGEISVDHPVIGVGLGNFQVEAPEYVRGNGELERVSFIAERAHVVHNVYLQILAETGIVGLGLLLGAIAMSISAATAAARRFERIGNLPMATLARASVVAVAAGLTASLFISNGSDLQLWVLLAIGPAMLAFAARGDGSPAREARPS